MTPGSSSHVLEATDADFEARVIERSLTVPVLVDFWAPWCGPCRMLGPVLESVAEKLAGAVEVVKLNTDENPGVAGRFGIQSIPAVKLFEGGKVAAEFVGALPEPRVRAFLEEHLPTGPTRKARAEAEAALRARELDRAIEIARAVPPDSPEWDRMQAIITLAENARDVSADDELGKAYRAALDRFFDGDHRGALDGFLALVKRDKRWRDEAARKAMLAVFQLVGVRSPLSDEFRKELMFAL